MKKLIVMLGCLLIAPLAFAQPSSTEKKQGVTTTEPVNVTGTIIRKTSEEGAAASYQPRSTLVVLMIEPVTFTGSVVVVACFLSIELG